MQGFSQQLFTKICDLINHGKNDTEVSEALDTHAKEYFGRTLQTVDFIRLLREFGEEM